MSGVQSTASDIDVDLGRLFASLARRWKRIVFVALAVTALALALAWLATPQYKAETKISIETRESPFTRPDSNGENERPILDEEGVASQVEMIQSTDLLKQVAQEAQSVAAARIRRSRRHVAVVAPADHRRPEERSRTRSRPKSAC